MGMSPAHASFPAMSWNGVSTRLSRVATGRQPGATCCSSSCVTRAISRVWPRRPSKGSACRRPTWSAASRHGDRPDSPWRRHRKKERRSRSPTVSYWYDAGNATRHMAELSAQLARQIKHVRKGAAREEDHLKVNYLIELASCPALYIFC